MHPYKYLQEFVLIILTDHEEFICLLASLLLHTHTIQQINRCSLTLKNSRCTPSINTAIRSKLIEVNSTDLNVIPLLSETLLVTKDQAPNSSLNDKFIIP